MLPQAMIEAFWLNVQEILERKSRLNASESRRVVAEYRAMFEPTVGEMIYHEEATNVAATIAKALKHDVLHSAKSAG